MAIDELLNIEFDVSPEFAKIDESLRETMQDATVNAHEDTLQALDESVTYTASSNPSQPVGSKYKRTFKLLKSYDWKLLHKKFPEIISVWMAKIPYAKYVLGEVSDKADIHQNRWDDLDILRKRTDMLFEEKLEKRYDSEVRIR